MKRLLLFLLLATAAGSAQAQTKQTRPVGAFKEVEAGGGIDVFLTQGSASAVQVEADPEVLARLVTVVKNGTLHIGWEQNYSWKNLLRGTRTANVYITCPQLQALSVSGGSDARGRSPFKADSFRLTASGGSDVTLTLNAKTLNATASGGSDLRLDGRVERQTVTVTGGSDYLAFGLHSTVADVTATGGSDANVSVDGELSSTASGGSDLRYKGNARMVKKSSSGGSSVQCAN